jgi:hypothetical protein
MAGIEVAHCRDLTKSIVALRGHGGGRADSRGFAGAILYATDPTLARWLMGASALPLLALMFGGRGGHPGRR